jgi:hypothetical protein
VWVDTLARVSPEADRADLRIRAQATFGLINSTPHTARNSPRGRVRALLEGMATAALTAPAA